MSLWLMNVSKLFKVLQTEMVISIQQITDDTSESPYLDLDLSWR